MAYSTGKVAVITGAGSGIGRALAQQFNAEGCRLALSDINGASLAETVASFSRPDIECSQQILDVADRAAVEAWARQAAQDYGHIDILINNAGVALSVSAEEVSYEDFNWLMDINFWGVVYGCKSFLPLLHKSTTGHIVNLSSVFGIIAVPNQATYNAAKFAVRGFTEAMRMELRASGIHVCCVHPGGVKTNIARDGRAPGSQVDQGALEQYFEETARTTPEQAAAQIITAVEKRRDRLLIGMDSKLITLISRLFPVRYDVVVRWLLPPMTRAF